MSAQKLDRTAALEIRDIYQRQNGGGITTLAARFNVSTATVHRVLTGEHTAVKGLPSLAGKRGNPAYKSQAWDRMKAEVTPRQAVIAARSWGPRRTVEIRAKACPVCGAPPREKCRNMRAAGLRYIESVHPARTAAAENVVPPGEDAGRE